MDAHTTSVLRVPDHPGAERVRTLERISDAASSVPGIRAHEVEAGDFVVIRTRNSVYGVLVLGQGNYRVEGGWFASEGRSNETRITGCTWGGSAIHTGLLAAPGMFVEFANGVRTTRVQEVRVFRGASGRVH